MENRTTDDELIRENASSILNVFCKMLGINQFMIVFKMRSGYEFDGISATIYGETDSNHKLPLILRHNYAPYTINLHKFMSPKMMRKVYNLQLLGCRAYAVCLRDVAEFYGCSEADIEYELASLLIDYASLNYEMYCNERLHCVQCPISLEEILINADLEGDV